MASINLVTGYTGEAHIKSEDDALLNSFLAGQDNSVINLDGEFNDTDCDISCDALVGGRLTRTDGAVNLTFTKPSSGYYRYDGIYIVYKKVTSGIESAELVYCEGTEDVSESGAVANMGVPTFEPGVISGSGLQLYSVAWDNAQTKTVTASAVEGSKLNSIGDAFFNDGDIATGACYCAGIVTYSDVGEAKLTVPLPKSLKGGQQVAIHSGSMSARIYFSDGSSYYYTNQPFVITGYRNNWANISTTLSNISAAKSGACTALVNYDFIITR